MKKAIAFLTSAVLAMMLLAGCAGAASPETPASAESPSASVASSSEAAPVESDEQSTQPESAQQYPDFKAAACLSGAITDNGWSASMYNAIKNLEEKYGISFDYTENVTVSDMEEYLRGYASMGYNLVVAHGSQFIDVVTAVAPDYPDTTFAVSYALGSLSDLDNVICVGAYNTGCLAGIIAGSLTDNNKVAMLGSTENPSVNADLTTFKLGVEMVNPDCEVITDFIGSATDTSKAYEMSMSLINSGVDVISSSANQAGLGVIQAAEEAGILAVGMDTDQYSVAPDAVVVSVIRNFNNIYDQMFDKLATGEVDSGLHAFGIREGGVILTDWHGWDEKLPADKMKLINDTLAGIADGSIQEPAPEMGTK